MGGGEDRCTGLLRDLLEFNKLRNPSFSALTVSKYVLQNVPDSKQLSSEAPPASCLQMADLTSGTMGDTLPRSQKKKKNLCFHAPSCINDDNTLLKLASLVDDSQLKHCGNWGEFGRRTDVEARVLWPRKPRTKAKSLS